jgi:hypothetical protein
VLGGGGQEDSAWMRPSQIGENLWQGMVRAVVLMNLKKQYSASIKYNTRFHTLFTLDHTSRYTRSCCVETPA